MPDQDHLAIVRFLRRIRAAYRVLRGTWVAIPRVEAIYDPPTLEEATYGGTVDDREHHVHR